MTEGRSPDKRAAFEALLDDGIAALHLDARAPGVRVPLHLRRRPWLVLNYSYRYRLHDFEIDDEGVHASLSFGGRPFPCLVPWAAVFAVSDDPRDRFHLWQEDMPAEALAALSEPGASDETPDTPPPRTPRAAPAATQAGGGRRASPFTVIDGGGQGEGRRQGHLERVK